MLKETLTYKNFDGVEVTETAMFNLTEAEVLEMETTYPGGYGGFLQTIIDTKDQPTLVKIFKDFLLKTYGEKSPDGRFFMKEDEDGHPLYRKNFLYSGLYSHIYMKLATDSEYATKFVKAVLPEKLGEATKK